MKLIDRYKGALLGLACGDAVGTTLEFQRPGNFNPIIDMIGGGPFKLNAGEWTDDTSMALCLAKSLIDCKGFDPYDQMDKYSNWFRKGYLSSKPGRCVDIGNATRDALNRYYNDYQPFCGNTSRESAGNGSIMRLAPVPMFYHGNLNELILKSGVSARTTHQAPQSIDATKYFGFLLCLAFDGKSKEEILEDYSESEIWIDEPLDYTIIEVMKGSFKHKNPPEIVGTGYVVPSLEAALWAFYTTSDFESCILKAANLGNDADTTAAIAGQLAGAFYGIDGITNKWLAKLYMREEIEQMAKELFELNAELAINE